MPDKSIKEKICTSYITCVEEKKILFKTKGYSIIECKKCGHRFTEIQNIENHVEKVYSDNYFFEGKEGYPNYLEEKEILYNYGLRFAKLISKYTNAGEILDVGCAAGFILKGFEKRGWNCWGIEPNETMASYGKNELGLHISTGSLETFETSQRFDLISLIQVIGHFYDLDKALQNLSELLKDKGLVLVESWNMRSGIARIMGRHWHEYSPPSVVHWFSDKTLVRLFKYYGFEIIDKGYPAKRINVKHALSLFEEKSPNFLLKKRIFKGLNNMFGRFTLFYPPIDVKWSIFRKL